MKNIPSISSDRFIEMSKISQQYPQEKTLLDKIKEVFSIPVFSVVAVPGLLMFFAISIWTKSSNTEISTDDLLFEIDYYDLEEML